MTTNEVTTDPKKVLIIDDEASFTQLLKLSLEDTHRFIVEVENNPCDAIARAEKFLPDVILLDVMMPNLDGGDLAARFQAHPALQSVPIIFLTAAVRREELPSGGGCIGGLRFLAKPASLQEVMSCLAGCLRDPHEADGGDHPRASALVRGGDLLMELPIHAARLRGS